MDSSENIGACTLQSLGGKATAIKLRKESIEKYYKNPNKCKNCGEIIHVGNSQVAQIKNKVFCSKNCASKFNRTGARRIKDRFCKNCNSKLEIKRGKDEKLLHAKFCDPCLKKQRLLSSPSITEEQKQNIDFYAFENQTKGSLFSRRKNWQSAASTFRKKARKIYDASGLPKKCFICGYDKHYEVCHKKSVSSFEDQAKASVINDISNLVAMCRNCHWEFDNGLIKF